MKLLFISIIALIIQFNCMAQKDETTWEKNVTIELFDPALNILISGSVILEVDSKMYEATFLETKQLFIFDSIPWKKG